MRKIFKCKFTEIIYRFLVNIDSLKNHMITFQPIIIKKYSDEVFQKGKVFPIFKFVYDYTNNKDNIKIEDDKIDLEELYNKLRKLLKEQFGCDIVNDNNVTTSTIDKDNLKSKKLINEIEEANKIDNQLKIIRESSLINCCAFFEFLIFQLLKSRFELHPESSNIENKPITITDVLKYSSIDELKEQLLSEKIQDIMRGSFNDWIKYFNDKLKIKSPYIDNLTDEINEIFQRRNLIIHNGGIVNSTYMNKVDNTLLNDVELGQILQLSNAYITKSIQTLEYSAVILSSIIWIHFKKDDWANRQSYLINEIGINYMKKEEWEFASSFFHLLLSDKKCDNSTKLIIQINYWISMKKLGEFDKIKKVIMDSDFSDKGIEFQLCRHILLENYDKSFIILEKHYPDKIDDEAISSWPIFSFISDDKRFKKYLRTDFESPYEFKQDDFNEIAEEDFLVVSEDEDNKPSTNKRVSG